jgi:hypothetical protein
VTIGAAVRSEETHVSENFGRPRGRDAAVWMMPTLRQLKDIELLDDLLAASPDGTEAK